MPQPGTFGALVADDDAWFRETVVEVLAAEGHRVAMAADGEEATRALREATEPLVALLDYRMPQMDGLDVLRAVAAETARPLQPYAYLLATPAAEHLLATPAAANVTPLITALLPKPFDLDELEAAIELAATRLAVRTQAK